MGSFRYRTTLKVEIHPGVVLATNILQYPTARTGAV
jgi:hypothetical protein